MAQRGERWRNVKFVAPVVLCFIVPVAVFAILIPMSQSGETSAASAPQATSVTVGTREADYRQAVSGVFTLNAAGSVTANGPGRLTAIAIAPGAEIVSGTRLFDIDGVPVFAMPQATPLYRDLTEGDTGPDVTSLQQFLIAAGLLSDTAGHTDGDFGEDTADAVCAFQEANALECTGVFSIATVAYIPPTVTAAGSLLKSVGGVVTTGDAVFAGVPTPAGVKLVPAAENGDLSAYGDEPVIISTNSGAELSLTYASASDPSEVIALYDFVQAEISAGHLAAPEAPADDDAATSTATVTGLLVRKATSAVVAVVPGNSIVVSQSGGGGVIAVRKGGKERVIRLTSMEPAIGQLGQVFTDAELNGTTILRDPSTSELDLRAACT